MRKSPGTARSSLRPDRPESAKRAARADVRRGTVLLERAQLNAEMTEIHERAEAIEDAVRRIPDREAERAAEIDAAGENEPVIHEPQAEPELEPSWHQGTQRRL